MEKKKFSIFLAAVISLQMFIVPISAQETADYAQISFDRHGKSVNMTVTETLEVTERGGRAGRMTNIKANNIYIYADVNKDFLYDLPNNTPIEIDVDYFDEGKGKFELDYGTHNPTNPKSIWGGGESVTLTNSKEWKTHTFYVEDMTFLNQCNYQSDFRIGVWGINMGWSDENVIFGGITVRRTNLRQLAAMNGRIDSEKVGNIFDINEEVCLETAYENKTDKDVGININAEVRDENDRLAWTGVISDSFAPNEKKTIYIKPQLEKKCAIYTISLKSETFYINEPETKYESTANGEFSVAWKVAPEDINPRYGQNQQIIALNRGDPENVTTLLSEGGMAYCRDYIPWNWVEKEKGVYKISDEIWEKVNKYKEKSIKPVMMLGFCNPLYDNGKTPLSDEAIAAYAQYCRFIVRELKDVTDAFEIWNEYNGGVNFNPSQSPASDYARLAKAAYKAIKEENPDVKVIGIVTAGVKFDWIEEAFKAGALEGMDIVCTHPYDWANGTFRWWKMREDSEKLRQMMIEYGGEKPVWWTEIGFSTSTTEYSYRDQASNTVMLYALAQAENLAECIVQYCLLDRENPDEHEDNWGLVRNYMDKEHPYSAKPSYLAVCAMNNLIGGMAEYKEMLFTEEKYRAFRFYNNKLKKDVMLLNSEDVSKYLTYDLGCGSVEIYDMYGNKIDEIVSENGIYRFHAEQEPKYIIGNFSKFSLADESLAQVTAENTEISVAADDYTEMGFNKTTNDALTVTVEDNESFEVIENNGFDGNRAVVKIHTKPDAKETVKFNVKITDANGRIRYSDTHTLTIIDRVSAEITTEQAVSGDSTHWRLRIKVKNMTNTQTISGTMRITSPEEESKLMPARRFENMKPGEEQTMLINLPYRVVKRTIALVAEAELDSGHIYTYEKKLDFGTAAYAHTKPKIDGNVDSGEWRGSWIGADEIKDVLQPVGEAAVTVGGDWRGPDDLSFSGTMMWDEEAFYMLAIVTDDIHSVDYSPKEPHYMYRGDSIQFSVDEREEIDSARRSDFEEIGLGFVPNYGSVAYRYKTIHSHPTGTVIDKAEIAIKRYATYTVYECKIPWSELMDDTFKPYVGRKMLFSALVNDNDAATRRGWIQYNSGIGYVKSAYEFGSMVLTN